MILVTGGCGYIGSHAVVELLNANQQVIVIDNLVNAKISVLDRIEKITGKRPTFFQCDLRDKEALAHLFKNFPIESVIHFAGLKAVGESVQKPLEYYDNNVNGTLVLLEVMREAGCKKLVFSSSATVYGDPQSVPITEDFPTSATNPYGQTKLMIEHILHDLCRADDSWSVVMLRYFNPAGAHESGLIGEDPNGIPNNLLPYITQVAVGKLSQLQVFGDDYPTKDGTGVRDYIHVVDLVLAHLKALKYCETHPGCEVFNLGTGIGYSVLEMVKAFEQVSDCDIPFEIASRREGDIAECWANADKAKKLLDWHAEFDLHRMLADSWRWQKSSPDGYS